MVMTMFLRKDIQAFIRVDEPYAWSVVIGTFLGNLLIVGFVRCYSFILLEFQVYANVPTNIMLMSFGILAATINLTSPVANILSEKLTTRYTIFASAAGCCLCSVALSFAQSIYAHLILIALLGFSLGLSYSPTLCMPPRCHKRRITLASGIGMCGSSVGITVSPYLMETLLNNYAVQGCFLVFGGIFLHLAVCAVLMPITILDSTGSHILIQEGCKSLSRSDKNIPTHELNEMLERNVKTIELEDETEAFVATSENVIEDGAHSNIKKKSFFEEYGLCHTLLFLLSFVFVSYGHSGVLSLIAGYGRECGVIGMQASFYVMLSGMVEIPSRIFFSWLNDQKIFSQATLIYGSALGMSATCFLSPFIYGRWSFATLNILYCFISAAYWSIHVPYLAKTFSLIHFGRLYGIVLATSSIVTICGQYIMGLVCTGSKIYSQSLRFVGVVFLFAFLLGAVKQLILHLKKRFGSQLSLS